MRRRPVPTLLGILLAAATLLASPARAVTYTSNALFTAQDRSVWATGPGVSVDTGDQFLGVQWDVGKTLGGIDSVFGVKFGAEVGAATSGKVGIDYALKLDSGTFDARQAGRVSVTVPNVLSGTPTMIGPVTLGTGFTGLPSLQISSSPTPITSLLQVTGPTLQGHLGEEASFHAFAGATVCAFSVCYGPSLGPIDFDQSTQIASINEGGTGSITVLGQTVNANQNVSFLGGLINANVRIPNLDSSSASTPGGVGSNGVLTATKRDGVAAVNANIAQIAADAIGLPIPLSGNLGPFGYNLLQANAGTALDVRQTLTLTPAASGKLSFSQPVTPIINGVVGAPTTVIAFNPGDDVSFLPGQTASLSFIPTIDLRENVRNRTDLVIDGNVNVQALGVDIAGLNIGPLINEQGLGGDITAINLFDRTFTDDFGTYVGQPVSIDFTCSAKLTGGEFPSFGICSSTRYVDVGPISTLPNGAVIDLIDYVSCSAHFVSETPTCIDLPAALSGPYFPGPGGPVFLAGSDPFGLLPFNPGASTTDSGEQTLLTSLGYSPTIPAFPIPPGDSIETIVPEPASFSLIAAACAGLPLTRRRRT